MPAPTVLVLDDNPDFVRAVAASARPLGLEVAATDDPDAFPALLAREEAVAAVVDCMLGDRSGLALLAVIGAQRPALPTLVVTGYGEGFLAQARQEAQSHGLEHFTTLAKPFAAAALRRFLEGARSESAHTPA
jgi:DNA-binding NtrC family response regulator